MKAIGCPFQFLSSLFLCISVVSSISGGSDSETAADEETLRAAKVSSTRSGLLAFFHARTLEDEEEAAIEARIKELGSESFRLRERAMAKLASRGPAAIGLLRAATQHADWEIRWRARKALAAVEGREVPSEVTAAAVRLLGRQSTAETATVLLAYAPFATEEDITEALCLALASTARRDADARIRLIEVLDDERPARRGAAGAALCLAHCRPQLPAVRRLLRDANSSVRRRVASALLETGEKSAIPILIALLTELPREEASMVEVLLVKLGGEESPAGDLADKTARRAYRDAWLRWWQRRGEGLNLAEIDLSHRWLGRTLIVAINGGRSTGCIAELDAQGKTRWQFENLQIPTDAQVIDERRVLVAEYGFGQVTERNHKGDILKRIPVPGSPLEARRLPNGNTFLVTRGQILEVDRAGKTVWNVTPRIGAIASACPLRGGELAVCCQTGELLRMDRAGKILSETTIARRFRPYGTHLHALPNGHVLVPHYYENKVAEYDGAGCEIWSASFRRPTTVQRLPNGHTLVGGFLSNVLVEMDGKGHEVKSQRYDGRIMSVHRR